MSKLIERLRYYDGEYLRSFDFTDEQSYHVEMRRRLNHRLHLYGIVYGLHLVQDQDSPPPPATPFFSIAPGMAIDHLGREIYLPAPYSLSPENVLNRPDLNPGETYELWLCYREDPTGLPAAGYRDCNEKDQNTRWMETFQVVLRPRKPKPGEYIPPDCGGVRLGGVTLGGANEIIQVNDGLLDGKPLRAYVGIRAQRIVAPDDSADTFDITALPTATKVPNKLLPGYLEIEPGVFNRDNVIAKKNVVIGDDFPLDASAANGKNLPKNIPPTGNLKITNDLFLNGDFYALVGGKWFGLDDYIKTRMPQVLVGTPATIVIPQTTTTSGVFHTTVQTTLPTVSKQSVLLSITETDWRDENDLTQFVNQGPIQVSVSPTIANTGGNNYDLAISWTVAPAKKIGSNDCLPVTKLVVGYVVVFEP